MEKMKNKEIEKALSSLTDFKQEFVHSAQRFIHAGDGNIHAVDLLAVTANNRAYNLIRGFTTLANESNYVVAIPLIRLQLDNVLRFYASTLVTDYNAFVHHVMNGKAVRDCKDRKGQKMTDTHLCRTLNDLPPFNGVSDLYDELCSHVHLSDRHFAQAVRTIVSDENRIGLTVGETDPFTEREKLMFCAKILDVSKMVIGIVEQWRHHKESLV